MVDHGVSVISCSNFEPNVFEVDSNAYTKLVFEFDEKDVLGPDGCIDRKKIRNLAKKKENLQIIEEIMWPELEEFVVNEINVRWKAGNALVFLDAGKLNFIRSDQVVDK